MMLRDSNSRFFSLFPLPAAMFRAVPVHGTGARRVSHLPPSGLIIFQCLLVMVMVLLCTGVAEARPPGTASTGGDVYTPMSLVQESYDFRVAAESSCLGEDDELEWTATGSLAPGESFSFTPAYPACNAHPAAITVVSSWNDGALELSSTVPDADFASWDAD